MYNMIIKNEHGQNFSYEFYELMGNWCGRVEVETESHTFLIRFTIALEIQIYMMI
jgi:hypothetical protein